MPTVVISLANGRAILDSIKNGETVIGDLIVNSIAENRTTWVNV